MTRPGVALLLLGGALLVSAYARADEPGALDRLFDNVLDQQLRRTLEGKPPGPVTVNPASGGVAKPKPPTMPPVGAGPNLPLTARISLKGYAPKEWEARGTGQSEVSTLEGRDLRLIVPPDKMGGLEALGGGWLAGDFDAELHFRPMGWQPDGTDSLVIEYRFAPPAAGADALVLRIRRDAGKPDHLELQVGAKTTPLRNQSRDLVLRRRGAACKLLAFVGGQGWLTLATAPSPASDLLRPSVSVVKSGKSGLDLLLMLGDAKALVLPD